MTPAQRASLLNFLGYGTPSKARLLFLGEKEYTPGGTELTNCEIRASSFAVPWEDKNRALRALASGFAARGDHVNANHFTSALTPGPNFSWGTGKPGGNSVSVWTWAAQFVTAWRATSKCVDDGPWFRGWSSEYTTIGTYDSDVALAELYPLPMKSVTCWPTDYVSAFGHCDADAYFQSVFPIGRSSPREQTLVQYALTQLPADALVIGYGRGGKGAEFWRRYDQILSPHITTFGGKSAKWHALAAKRIEIGISSRGHLVARIGFPWTRPNANPVTQQDIPLLVEGLRALRAQNP